jgi:putative membrane protein insertion efficiency factor
LNFHRNLNVTAPENRARFFFLARLPGLAGRGLVIVYRYTLSPLIGPHCRHLPGCAEYADEAIDRFGLWAGGWMALARILRCHPWGTAGLDFVPTAVPERSRWFLPWRYGRWRRPNDPSRA